MRVRLQKISWLSRLFLFTGPFLHYRRFWAEDSLVKFGVHSWQTRWFFYPPCCIVNHLFVNVVKDVARSLVKQFSRLAGGFLSARLRLPLKDWESLGNSLYPGVLLQQTAFPERPIFSWCFRCIFDFKFSVLSNGSFGWGNRGKRCHWKDDEESATDRQKNGS